jgi:ferric-dicitrate binding protein FerR (iron transport regulator)
VRIVTGPRFRGAVLRVVTPEADVEVIGTTLAVIRDATATCVCAFEGSVRMGPRTLELETVPPGMRRFLYNDGRPPATVAIDAMGTMKLQMFHDNFRPKLSSAR